MVKTQEYVLVPVFGIAMTSFNFSLSWWMVVWLTAAVWLRWSYTHGRRLARLGVKINSKSCNYYYTELNRYLQLS